MGLILCEPVKAKNPFHIDVLSLDIYSYEELCYIIFENPILVTEGIVSDTLFDFIRNELNLENLADNLSKKKSNGVDDEDILVYIIDSCDLYNNAESLCKQENRQHHHARQQQRFAFVHSMLLFQEYSENHKIWPSTRVHIQGLYFHSHRKLDILVNHDTARYSNII